MSSDVFGGTHYTALQDRVNRFTALTLNFVSASAPTSFLEIGCGTGEQLRSLAQALPQSRFQGVDISAVSITSGNHDIASFPYSGRVKLFTADYMAFQTDPVDILIADSVLQNLPVPTKPLLAKMAQDVKPGGKLLLSLPFDCTYNQALWLVRRALRALRNPLLDKLVFQTSVAFHGNQIAPELLQERILYMYLVPYRYLSKDLNAEFRSAGFRPVSEIRLPHASVAQPIHALSVWERVA